MAALRLPDIFCRILLPERPFHPTIYNSLKKIYDSRRKSMFEQKSCGNFIA